MQGVRLERPNTLVHDAIRKHSINLPVETLQDLQARHGVRSCMNAHSAFETSSDRVNMDGVHQLCTVLPGGIGGIWSE